MKHHFTRNTVEASAWCKKCGKETMHRVDRDEMQGRLGPCLVCMEKPAPQKVEQEKVDQETFKF